MFKESIIDFDDLGKLGRKQGENQRGKGRHLQDRFQKKNDQRKRYFSKKLIKYNINLLRHKTIDILKKVSIFSLVVTAWKDNWFTIAIKEIRKQYLIYFLEEV